MLSLVFAVLRSLAAAFHSRRDLVMENLAFLRNQTKQLIAVDFFTVPTVTFRVLFVFVVLAHERRRVMHFAVTEAPSAAWAGQQIVNAFPFATPPKYLLRDRDGIYGAEFTKRVTALGVEEKPIAPRAPWQNPYAERLIGTIRRECLDRVIIIDERHLHAVLECITTGGSRRRDPLGKSH
jgi:transposase InsO family protein